MTGVQYFVEHHHGYFYILTNYPTEAVDLADYGGYYLARCIAERSMLNEWEVMLFQAMLHGHSKIVPYLCLTTYRIRV